MADIPPDWAIERAVAVMQLSDAWAVEAVKEGCVVFSKNVLHVARYISQHEQPPVDPLLQEAREMVASDFGGEVREFVLCGKWDQSLILQAILRGLRRGISLSQGNRDE